MLRAGLIIQGHKPFESQPALLWKPWDYFSTSAPSAPPTTAAWTDFSALCVCGCVSDPGFLVWLSVLPNICLASCLLCLGLRVFLSLVYPCCTKLRGPAPLGKTSLPSEHLLVSLLSCSFPAIFVVSRRFVLFRGPFLFSL